MPRILVIDDEEDVRKAVGATLRAAGHDVFLAPDGDKGLALLRSNGARPIDLVITDLLMPDKEGLETISEVKAEFPGMKIIAMTGGGEKIKTTGGLLYTAEQAGADSILLKPFSSSALYSKVSEALGAHPK